MEVKNDLELESKSGIRGGDRLVRFRLVNG